jgi:hypothetical protein
MNQSWGVLDALAVTDFPDIRLKFAIHSANQGDDIFDLRAVIRVTGCMVVVRPDQYVSHVLPLHGYDGLVDFFAGILIDAK